MCSLFIFTFNINISKRESRRATRRYKRDRRCGRRCEELMEQHDIEKEDAALMADFYDKFGGDEVGFIADFLNESD